MRSVGTHNTKFQAGGRGGPTVQASPPAEFSSVSTLVRHLLLIKLYRHIVLSCDGTLDRGPYIKEE